MSKGTLGKVWNAVFWLVLLLWGVEAMAHAMDWPMKLFIGIPNTLFGLVVFVWILAWDWRQMKRRQREGERFWLFQALLVLILMALAVTVLFIFVPSLAPWA